MHLLPAQSPFPLGVDPIWHGRKTELPYMNSMKMKMSILIGVTHMNFGILMSLFNYMDTRCARTHTGALNFKRWHDRWNHERLDGQWKEATLDLCHMQGHIFFAYQQIRPPKAPVFPLLPSCAGTCCPRPANSSPR